MSSPTHAQPPSTVNMEISPTLHPKSYGSFALEQKHTARSKLPGQQFDLICVQLSTQTLSGNNSEVMITRTHFDYSNLVKAPHQAVKVDPQGGDQENVVSEPSEVQRPEKRVKSGPILRKLVFQQEGNEEPNPRVDVTGTPIVRGSKKHTVSFSPKIHNVVLVENWKEYNKEDLKDYCCRPF